MVAKGGAAYRSANAGELSRDAAGRADVKQFYSAGLRFKNVEPVPLSGFRRMAGSFDVGPVRGRVAVLAQSAVVVTPGPHTGTQTIWQAGIAGAVAAVDCGALAATIGLHDIVAQVLVGAVWTQLGPTLIVGTAPAAITFAVAPTAQIAATGVRLVAVFSVSASIAVGAVTVLTEGAELDIPRYSSLRHDSGARYFLSLQTGFLDIYEDDLFVAGVYLPTLTLAVLPQVNFYAENATLGLGHRDLETLRVRRAGSSVQWVRDVWPYEGVPKVDLGGVYAKTDDIWEIQVSWAASVTIYLTLIVDGESTTGVPYVNGAGVPVPITDAGLDLTLTAANMKAALEALPSLGPTVTVTIVPLVGDANKITVTFGGALSGREYQLVSTITNTASAAALSSHIQIGKTDFEPLFSTLRGWPGVFGLAQDRLAYGDIKAEPSAVSFSQAGEYFKLNIEASGASAARLDKLRGGQVSERVLAFAEATYFLVLTDRGVHFAANRTVNKTDPLNFVQTASSGTVPNCEPVNIEGKIYYVGVNPKSDPPVGHELVSLSYSELETAFEAIPEHIFATHLVMRVMRTKGQKASTRSDASRLWLLRDDGRLIVANIIRSQEVVGYCEWLLAAGGLAREIHNDAGNDLRVAVARGAKLRHERLDRATLFQGAVTRTPDLAGEVTGLDLHEGLAVWALAENYALGPFTVADGTIELDNAYTGTVQVGLWQAPLWESMPRYFITRNDEVIKRPGRIHTCVAEILETTSIAIGANGGTPENVPLLLTGDPVDQAAPPKSTTATRLGMLGHMTGTTLVVTQVRPGELHVRDLVIEEKL